MNCPHCGKPINAAAMLGSISTPAKAQAARENAKLGGWPKGKKRGKRKRVARRRNKRNKKQLRHRESDVPGNISEKD